LGKKKLPKKKEEKDIPFGGKRLSKDRHDEFPEIFELRQAQKECPIKYRQKKGRVT